MESKIEPDPTVHWWVYIILTNKGQYYTGITTDIPRRFLEHSQTSAGVKNAKGAKFFHSQIPVEVVFKESFLTRGEATRRELEIKKMSHSEKLELHTYRQV